MYPRRGLIVRLACVRHAASVRSEPVSDPSIWQKNRTNTRYEGVYCLTFEWNETCECLTILCYTLTLYRLFNFQRTNKFFAILAKHNIIQQNDSFVKVFFQHERKKNSGAYQSCTMIQEGDCFVKGFFEVAFNFFRGRCTGRQNDEKLLVGSWIVVTRAALYSTHYSR